MVVEELSPESEEDLEGKGMKLVMTLLLVQLGKEAQHSCRHRRTRFKLLF